MTLSTITENEIYDLEKYFNKRKKSKRTDTRVCDLVSDFLLKLVNKIKKSKNANEQIEILMKTIDPCNIEYGFFWKKVLNEIQYENNNYDNLKIAKIIIRIITQKFEIWDNEFQNLAVFFEEFNKERNQWTPHQEEINKEIQEQLKNKILDSEVVKLINLTNNSWQNTKYYNNNDKEVNSIMISIFKKVAKHLDDEAAINEIIKTILKIININNENSATWKEIVYMLDGLHESQETNKKIGINIVRQIHENNETNATELCNFFCQFTELTLNNSELYVEMMKWLESKNKQPWNEIEPLIKFIKNLWFITGYWINENMLQNIEPQVLEKIKWIELNYPEYFDNILKQMKEFLEKEIMKLT